MRAKGVDNFKCVVVHSCDCEGNDQQNLEQKFIKELKPTLNSNSAQGVNNVARDKARLKKTIDELRKDTTKK